MVGGCNIEKNTRVLIVEDIVSTGGSIFELIELLNKYEANIIGKHIGFISNKEAMNNMQYRQYYISPNNL